jgi:hypothetical protein
MVVHHVCDEYFGKLMLSGSNSDKLNTLCTDLENQYEYGNDLFSKSVDQCHFLLKSWTASMVCTPCAAAATPTLTLKQEEEALIFAQKGQKGNAPALKTKDDSSGCSSSTSTPPNVSLVFAARTAAV